MNPVLPLNEYIPDVEAHVFNDRVYLYGSHDAANSKRFCIQDYTVYSADVNDLTKWKHHGVTYRKEQDPHSTNGKPVDFYAPDCVRGNDERYYLYYSAMGPNTRGFGPMSVAVADEPYGPFEYLGDIQYPDGSPVMDFLTNDPAVINDNGHIYLYYGWGLGRDFRSKFFKPIYDRVLSKIGLRPLSQIRKTEPSVLSCAFAELENDMLTVKAAPKAVLDSKTTAPKDSDLYNHPFYEAPSIRKIKDTYYLVYSSGENNELAYATSKYPDRDFQYRGVIISNSDLGYNGNTQRKNNSSTIHGSIECINGNWYVFYHRCTNNTDYSRQVCIEPITIDEDGFIKQVEMTTSGVEKVLKVKGSYSAGICCNLITPTEIRLGVGKQQSLPRITQRDDRLLLADLTKGCKAVYKYLDLSEIDKIRIKYRGKATIKVNGITLNENNEVKTNKNDHCVINLEVTDGKCDIEELEFI